MNFYKTTYTKHPNEMAIFSYETEKGKQGVGTGNGRGVGFLKGHTGRMCHVLQVCDLTQEFLSVIYSRKPKWVPGI